MRPVACIVFFLSFILLSCDSHKVEQIPVEIPAGVTVPEGMVYIPAGGFIMGHADDPKTEGGQTVMTDAYFIDRYEVSRGEYQEFKPADNFDPKRARLPVAWVTHQNAESYCQFRGKRLPTETEWEKAARGVDGRKWPWELYFDHPNNGFSGLQVEPVDKRSEWISPYGVFGMGHNVWEWTEDWYTYQGQPVSEKGMFKVIRGGLTQTHLTIKFSPAYFRNWIEPTASFNFLGFRCAMDA
ncbi:MAG: hypothetical protein NPINA01_26740 [Nitrospinaceae bacterium]|nr:MAG: hypothetical protein NPINA01_26740 [Nitrospinaceae bacterium]